MSKNPSFRDLKKLSAYLDGELKDSARKKLESRIARDPELAAALDDLRLSRTVLRRTPQRRVPRNFTISPQMVAKRPPMPRLVPALNYAALAAMLLFVFSFTSPFGAGGSMADEAMAPAPMLMEAPMEESAAVEAPSMEMAAEPAADSTMEDEAPVEEAPPPPAEAPAGEAGANLAETERAVPTPAEEPAEGMDTAEKAFTATPLPTPTVIPVPLETPQVISSAPLLTPYQRVLIVLLVIFVLVSWGIRRAAVAKWRKKST